jgi:hypothetical protein
MEEDCESFTIKFHTHQRTSWLKNDDNSVLLKKMKKYMKKERKKKARKRES